MLWQATHVVDVLTGVTATDDYGDATDGTTVAATGVLASILDKSAQTFRKDTQTPRSITSLTGRVPSGTPIQDGDRLRDTRSPTIWLVDSVSHNANPIHDPGITLELRRL